MGYKVKGFSIKIGGDLDKVEKQFQRIEKHIKAISKFNIDVTGLKQINKQSAELRKLNVQLGKLSRSTKKLSQDEKEARVSVKRLNAELNIASKANERLVRSMNKTRAATQNNSKATQGLGKTMRFAFKAGVVAAALSVITRKIKQATKETAEFNRQTRIAGLISSGGVGKGADVNTKKLRDEALRIGGLTEFTAKQIADLEVAYGKLGFTADETLSLISTTSNAATVSQEDLALTAEVVGSAINSFGFEVEDAGHVADVMAKAFTNSALNLQKFKVGIAIAGSSARAANVPFEKSVAMLSVLSDAGFEASMAATSLRNILLISQTEGEDYNVVLDKIAGSSRQLAEASSHFGRRAAAASVILGIEKEKIAALNEELVRSIGFSKETAEAIRDDLQGSLDKLNSSWKNLTITLTSTFAPAIKATLDWAADMVTAYTRLSTGADTYDKRVLNMMKNQNTFIVVASKALTLGLLNPFIEAKNIENKKHFQELESNINDINRLLKGDVKANLEEYKKLRNELKEVSKFVGNEEVDRMAKVIAEVNKRIVSETSKTKIELQELANTFSKELGNTAKITEKRKNEIVREISDIFKADNLLPDSEKMSAAMRNRLYSLIRQAGKAAEESTKTLTDKIQDRIDVLFQKRNRLGENDNDKRALLDEQIRDLQARLENIKFVAEPIVGIVNELNKELADLNKEFNKSLSSEDQNRIATLIAQGKSRLKDIELIKKRANAEVDPNLTGVIKEDQLSQYQDVFKAYQGLIASIEEANISAAQKKFQLAEANRIKENEEFELDLQRFTKNSAEWEKIVSKINANNAKSDLEGRKLIDQDSLDDIRKRYIKLRSSITGSSKDSKREIEKLDLQEEIDILKKDIENKESHGERVVELKKSLDKKLAELRQKNLDDSKAKAEEEAESIKKVLSGLGEWVDNVSKLSNLIFESGFAQDERDSLRIKKTYEERIKAASGNAAQIEKLEKRRDAELEKIDRRKFERQKRRNIAQASIQGAQAILSLLAAAPGFADIATFGIARVVSIALTAATVAAQVATIKKQQYPGFYEGGDTGSRALFSDDDGRAVAGYVHTNEYVISEEVLMTKAGQDLRARAELIRSGGKDLTTSPSNLVVNADLKFSDIQMAYLAQNTSNAVVAGVRELALEMKVIDDMHKRAS